MPLTQCTYSGTIPKELFGGEYVRNGVNPVTNEELGRDAHWFDGDGMLTGVMFQKPAGGEIEAYFVNQYILTDLFLSAKGTPSLHLPILPSIATLVNPLSTLLKVILAIFRTVLLVTLSHLPGSSQAIKKISVANTALLYHDGRALATCESGPPMRVQLPGLETVGWFNGNHAEGEPDPGLDGPGFGGEGMLSWVKEWTTGHPKVDPLTKDMILFHCGFVAPYVHYSVVPAARQRSEKQALSKLLNIPVPGCSGGKMMHDFGVSRGHTIIMDLPLSLDPFNQIKGKPPLFYDSSKPSRFGVFPRCNPSKVKWFETAACCIFHTANAWDTFHATFHATSVHFLACRQTSAAVIFSSGNINPPGLSKLTSEPDRPMSFSKTYHDEEMETDIEKEARADGGLNSSIPAPETSQDRAVEIAHDFSQIEGEESQCRLYYYVFSVDPSSSSPQITRQYALSAVPFEFPTLNPAYEMSAARYIYGCSTSISSFGAALGKAAKIDVLVKMDVLTLIERGESKPPKSITGCVDMRNVENVLNSEDPHDSIRLFRMPEGWYAQEARFVARKKDKEAVDGNGNNEGESEDDGYLLFYAFDESQLDVEGEAPPDARSEFWILDAKDMRTVVARVRLPQRVPYGLHGNWFDEDMIRNQRPVERFRSLARMGRRREEMRSGGWLWRRWMGVRARVESWLG